MMVPGFLSTFFCKILILVHNFTDFYILGCTSQLMLRCSTYSDVAISVKMRDVKHKYFIPLNNHLPSIFFGNFYHASHSLLRVQNVFLPTQAYSNLAKL